MLLQADAYNIPLPDQSVHAVVTSPPYWGLRKYSGAQGRGEFPNLGLEKTPEEHIERMVSIFREIKRVLRDDGVVWLNYGDCYAGSGGPGDQWDKLRHSKFKGEFPKYDNPNRLTKLTGGNLMLMPHRVAIALQADGWIVRNDNVWWKRNPMPESVAGWRWESKPCDCGTLEREKYLAETMENKGMERHRAFYEDSGHRMNWNDPDCLKCQGTGKVGEPVLRKGSWRHTRAHEYIFQLVKGMGYYCNQEAARVKHDQPWRGRQGNLAGGHRVEGFEKEEYTKRWKLVDENKRQYNPSGRNPRSVLDVPTAPYKGAHYATFPPNLIAPLIRASCPRRSCPECGQAWAPVVERVTESTWQLRKELGATGGAMDEGPVQQVGKVRDKERHLHELPSSGGKVLDYRPTCSHNHEPIPGIVLDPFTGSGTTGAVARELQRRWIGLDISMDYIDQQAKVRALKWTPSNALDDLPLFKKETADEA